MELLLILLVLWVLVMPVVALVTAQRARQLVDAEISSTRAFAAGLHERVTRLQQHVADLEGPVEPPAAPPARAMPPPPPVVETPPSVALQPPLPPPTAVIPPVVVPKPKAPEPVVAKVVPQPSLEQFMGAKLFAWAGGLALFLGIVFFVKLSLERGWISPPLRVGIGLLTGAVLVIAGLWTHRKERFVVLGQTLCATGIVALYGVAYAAHALYAVWPFDSATLTFGFMSAVTVAAFVLAVRLDARVVAALGMLGGFLTPVLCSTGRDQAAALFSYIALLDLGVLAVVRRTKWPHFTEAAAAGTQLMLWGWMMRFLVASGYTHDAATWVPVGLMLGFTALFATATAWMKKDGVPATGALLLAAGALITAFVFLGYSSIAERPSVLYALVFGINVLVMLVVWQRPEVRAAQGVCAGVTFMHLWVWTQKELHPGLLGWALGLYLVFGIMQTLYAVLWQRRGSEALPVASWTPLVSVVLMLLPLACLPEIPMMLWPALLMADLLVIAVAMASGMLMPVVAACGLTFVIIGGWLLGKVPAQAGDSLNVFLYVCGGFAFVLGAASQWLRKRHPEAPGGEMLPVTAAVMPFVLLIAAVEHLHVVNPTPVFGVALALVAFLLLLARSGSLTALMPVTLVGVIALQGVWFHAHGDAGNALMALTWQAGFYLLFSLYPMLSGRVLETRVTPWITAAAAGLATYPLVSSTVSLRWPSSWDGMVAAAFAVAPLFNLAWVMRRHTAANPARNLQAGANLGVALFFITLFIAIQFDRQWITLGWAVEGALLLGTGFGARLRSLRRAGLVVVGMALVRLFFWDLANSESIYRIAALIGVALVALGVSWLYQRFLSEQEA